MTYRGGALYFPERLFSAASRILGAKWALFKAKQSFQFVGKNVYIAGSAYFRQPSIVSLSDDCKIYENVEVIADYPGEALRLDCNVQINVGVHLDTTGGLSIGENSLISEQAKIYTHDHGRDPRSVPLPRPKNIGKDVWIGMRAIVLPSCQNIGDGAIIGAGAVVTRDVEEGTTVVGNPARALRKPSPPE